MQFLQNRVKIPDDQVVDTNQEMLRFGWSFFLEITQYNQILTTHTDSPPMRIFKD